MVTLFKKVIEEGYLDKKSIPKKTPFVIDKGNLKLINFSEKDIQDFYSDSRTSYLTYNKLFNLSYDIILYKKKNNNSTLFAHCEIDVPERIEDLMLFPNLIKILEKEFNINQFYCNQTNKQTLDLGNGRSIFFNEIGSNYSINNYHTLDTFLLTEELQILELYINKSVLLNLLFLTNKIKFINYTNRILKSKVAKPILKNSDFVSLNIDSCNTKRSNYLENGARSLLMD